MRTCVDCGHELHKTDIECTNCGSTKMIKEFFFWHRLLGFVIGIFIPSLIDLFMVIFLSDKQVLINFGNATIIGRSKWRAARSGIIFGALLQTIVVILLILAISGMYVFSIHNLPSI